MRESSEAGRAIMATSCSLPIFHIWANSSSCKCDIFTKYYNMGTLSDLDEMGPSMGPPFESRPSLEEKKRSRIQLSCTQCRSKK